MLTVSDKGNGSSVPPLDPGMYAAVCYGMVDLGTVHSERFNTDHRKMLLMWEIPSERLEWTDKEGNEQEGPRVMSKRYTASLNEKAHLRKDLRSWRGRDFTPDDLVAFQMPTLIGKPCQLNVVHVVSKTNGNTYANVDTVLPAAKGVTVKGELPQVYYGIEEHGVQIPELPPWIVTEIQKSPEYQIILNGGSPMTVPDADDQGPAVPDEARNVRDIPF